jgi:hypothetical protein
MSKRTLFLIGWLTAFLAATAPAFAADVIPSARRTTWTPGTTVGVRGGFAQYSNNWTTSAITGLDPTGVSDASAAIQTAINNAANDTILTIPAGTYRCNSSITVGHAPSGGTARNRRILRGAGAGETILMFYNAASLSVGGKDTSWDDAYSKTTTTSSISAGGNSVTRASTDGWVGADGLVMRMSLKNSYDPVVIASVGGDLPHKFYAMITSVVGSTVTFSPSVPFAVASGTTIRRETGSEGLGVVSKCGIENLTANLTNSTAQSGVVMYAAVDSWLYDVEAIDGFNYCFNTGFTVFCEAGKIRSQGYQSTGGSSTAAYLLGSSTGMYMYDSILKDNVLGVMVTNGVNSSVIAYNFIDDIKTLSADTIAAGLNINHDPHNTFNLIEGNITGKLQDDGYHGSSSNQTIFRNWLTATGAASFTGLNWQYAVTLNRFARNHNVVGNLLGRSDVGISWLKYMNAGTGYITTSSTSLTIGTGGLSVTIGTGLNYTDSDSVALFRRTSDSTKWMSGRITGYNSGTGAATFTSYVTNGSGTFSDWTVVGGQGYGASATEGLIYTLGMPRMGSGGFPGLPFQQILVAPSLGVPWRAWSGQVMVPRGAYDSGYAYSSGDTITYTAEGPYNQTGGENAGYWLAVNAAKNGLTTWTTPGPSQSDWNALGPLSFTDYDYDVYLTLLFKGNWNALNDAVPAGEALSGDTYPNSYYLDAKPSWFGSITWPPIDATNPPANQNQTATFAAMLPAAWREINGNENYLSGGGGGGAANATVNQLNVGTLNIQ